jgi:hypothetical protein
MRSRVIMIRLSGRMTPFVIASRSSATFLPEKSRLRAAEAADPPVLRAAFCACCCRPRALPPALAARLRAAVLRVEPEPLDLRDVDEDEDDERLRDEPELRAEPELRELEARELEPRELELRELEARELPPDLRPPLELDFLRDEPPPLLPLDSAIAILLEAWCTLGCAPHYMPTVAVT